MGETGNLIKIFRRLTVRAALAIVLAAGLATSLLGCSPAVEQQDPNVQCTATAPGSASNAVSVAGELGSKPKVAIKAPTAPKATERTVVIAGDGETALSGDTVSVVFTLYNGQSGAEITGTEYESETTTDFLLDTTQFLPGLVKTLECTRVGSRVVGVIPPGDSFGDVGSAELGVGPGESVVLVADLVAIAEPPEPPLPRADGEDQAPTDGFPTVELDDAGRPTITIPDATPPTDVQVAVLKEGTGEVVPEAADVVVHYVGVNWNTRKIFDESWARGQPSTFNSRGVIEGFTLALEGQTVGSQVIVIIPPEYGYGPEGSGEDIGGTDTLVFVVDILGLA